MMKKILITGVYASGKTSLIDLLKKSLESQGKRVVVIHEVARQCPFDLNKSQSLMATSWLVMAQLNNELTQQEATVDYIIFDRGLPDIIAHTEYVLSEEQDDLNFFRMLDTLGRTSIHSYNYIFLSTSSDEFSIHVDELRVDDVQYQKKLELLHLNYLIRSEVNYILLKEKNEDRLQQIIDVIT